MNEFLTGAKAALPGALIGALVSFVISGLILYYLRHYIDRKLLEEEKHRAEEKTMKVQRAQLEMRRRRALGRLLFWMHRGIVHPPSNGELEDAMEEFQAVEDEQKALDQQILARFEMDSGI